MLSFFFHFATVITNHFIFTLPFTSSLALLFGQTTSFFLVRERANKNVAIIVGNHTYDRSVVCRKSLLCLSLLSSVSVFWRLILAPVFGRTRGVGEFLGAQG